MLPFYKTLPSSKSVYAHILHYVLYCFHVELLILNILMTFYWFAIIPVFKTIGL